MKIRELRQKPDEELQKLLQIAKSRTVELSFVINSGNVKNVQEMRENKKDIARIYTLVKERAKN